MKSDMRASLTFGLATAVLWHVIMSVLWDRQFFGAKALLSTLVMFVTCVALMYLVRRRQSR